MLNALKLIMRCALCIESANLVLPEPHLIDIDTDGDVQVVFLDEQGGC